MLATSEIIKRCCSECGSVMKAAPYDVEEQIFHTEDIHVYGMQATDMHVQSKRKPGIL